VRQTPPPEAPFADKMAYYRTQHTSKGCGRPIWSARRSSRRACADVRQAKARRTDVHWGLGHANPRHKLFEKNLPSTRKGWITYQLTGVIDVCEQYGEMLARTARIRSQRKARLR